MRPSKRLLLGTDLSSQTPEGLIEYIKSLVMRTESKASKSVDEITITFGNRIIIRVRRNPKYVTVDEIARLAVEYKKEVAELNALFKLRKIEVRADE